MTSRSGSLTRVAGGVCTPFNLSLFSTPSRLSRDSSPAPPFETEAEFKSVVSLCA
ncbi:MAG: hypothetical protein M3264_07030 [Thermoproteota archaeon]|nr:hypothetical protein [Thermoproteota archaeon]